MTPQEKSEQLVSSYLLATPIGFHIEDAKKCALIAVQEIILSNPHSNPFNTDVYSTMSYWQEVKTEIEKL
jgi:hypothetical protein